MLAAVEAGAPVPLAAQTARTGGGASAQLVLELQQITAERNRLTVENAKLEQDLAALESERDGLKKSAEGAERRVQSSAAAVSRAERERDLAAHEAEEVKTRTQALVDTFRETLQSLRTIETDSNTAKQTLNVLDRDLKVCIDRDVNLYRLDAEILGKSGPRSLWQSVELAEPFTRIARIREENEADDFRARAGDLRVHPSLSASAPAPAADK